MERRRVVVTGMGALTPIGHSMPESWEAAKQGVCGVGPLTRYDASAQRVKIAAEVKNYQAEDFFSKKEIKHMPLFTQFAVITAREAVRDSQLVLEQENLDRCGVIFSSGIGGLDVIETEHDRGVKHGFDRVSPFYVPMSIINMAAGQISIDLGFRGPSTCAVAACAGGTYAVGDAFHMIRDGYADVMLCGGTEAGITPLGVGGFTSMKALSFSEDLDRASIPFDAERNGFVMGEGAGSLVLEELEHAQKRGARIYAEVVGYGMTCDAYHITAPEPEGRGASKAMEVALQDAQIGPEEVGYINAHGTSTSLNDAGEIAAVKKVFGQHAYALAISSTKSMTGHMLGASGAVEAIFTVLALYDQFLPPTIHYRVPDPACDLDVVPNEGREAKMRYALSNSFGFGGHNGSILLKKWEE